MSEPKAPIPPEALGQWLDSHLAEPKRVSVTLETSALVIRNHAGQALAHWSLAAIERLPSETDALYAPGPESEERLILSDPAMIEQIEKVRLLVARASIKPGRLRTFLTASLLAGVLAGLAYWLPGAVVKRTATLMPETARLEYGRQLLTEIAAIAGTPCARPEAQQALRLVLARISDRDRPPVVVVFPDLEAELFSLPGGIMVLSSRLLAAARMSPEALAGALLVETVRWEAMSAEAAFLNHLGAWAVLELLTTGSIDETRFPAVAQQLITSAPRPVELESLRRAFEAARLSTRPYALALDPSGQSMAALIEADPAPSNEELPLLTSQEWEQLRMICER